MSKINKDYQPKPFIVNEKYTPEFEFIQNGSEEAEVKTIESIREEIWEEMVHLEPDRKNQWIDIRYQTLREILQKLGHVNHETLSHEWIDENLVYADINGKTEAFLNEHSVRNILVPKQEITEEQAWEVISRNTDSVTIQNNIEFLEANGYVVTEEQEEEQPETVARVIFEYIKATQRFKEILGMEIEETE